MKVLIVFIALVLVFTCLCINSDDLSRYKQINIALKALAEEAACGGALMTGDTDSEENLVINYNDACLYIEMLLDDASKRPLFSEGELSYKAELGTSQTSLTVYVTYFDMSTPVFHLYQSRSNEISRKSTYEWVCYTKEE